MGIELESLNYISIAANVVAIVLAWIGLTTKIYPIPLSNFRREIKVLSDNALMKKVRVLDELVKRIFGEQLFKQPTPTVEETFLAFWRELGGCIEFEGALARLKNRNKRYRHVLLCSLIGAIIVIAILNLPGLKGLEAFAAISLIVSGFILVIIIYCIVRLYQISNSIDLMTDELGMPGDD